VVIRLDREEGKIWVTWTDDEKTHPETEIFQKEEFKTKKMYLVMSLGYNGEEIELMD